VRAPKLQVGRVYLGDHAAFDAAAERPVDSTGAAAACGFDIVFFIPFDERQKEQAEVHISHIHFDAPVPAAARAYNGLAEFQLFLALAYTDDQEHA